MGNWAKSTFGKEQFGKVGFVLAGTSTPEFEKEVLGYFDEVISFKDKVYHAYLARKGTALFPLVFNVYGAPAMMDSLAEMHDGGCRQVFFVGFAYGGFQNLDIGEVVMPEKSYHFEGIYQHIEPSREISYPDKDLMQRVDGFLKSQKIHHTKGTNISVPSVYFQLPHANEKYRSIKPVTVEMELAACYARSEELGIRVAGLLIISDNRQESIGNEEKKALRRESKSRVLKALIRHVDDFVFPDLPVKKVFTINEYLANVIHDPSSEVNVYKKK